MAFRPIAVNALLLVSPEAEEDLDRIWRYLLSEAGLDTANRVQAEVVEAIEGLARNPGKGHKRSDLTDQDVLFYNLYQYLLVYRRGGGVKSSPFFMRSGTCRSSSKRGCRPQSNILLFGFQARVRNPASDPEQSPSLPERDLWLLGRRP